MPLKKLNKTGIENEQNDDGVILRDTDEATIVKAAAVYKSMLNDLVENYITENEDVYNNSMFYGGVPIDLEAESLLHIAQYNITQDNERQYLYNITSKLDGLRLLMFIHPLLESVMFVDRKPNFYEASLNKNYAEKYNVVQNFTSAVNLNKLSDDVSKLNTQKNYTLEETEEVPKFSMKQNYTIHQTIDFQILCDGEYYEETNEFFVFDLLYYNNRYICMYPFFTRLKELEGFFKDKKIKRLLNDIFLQTGIHIILKPYINYSHLLQQSVTDIPDYVQRNFNVYVWNEYEKKRKETEQEKTSIEVRLNTFDKNKNLPEYKFYHEKHDTLENLLELLKSKQKGSFLYNFDGLIFTPTTTKYVLFDSWKYPMNILYKWKPRHDHTVDFFVNDNNQLMVNRQSIRELFEYKWFGTTYTPRFYSKENNVQNKIVECDISDQQIIIGVVETVNAGETQCSTGLDIINALTSVPSYVYFYIRRKDRSPMIRTSTNQFSAYTNKKIHLVYNWNQSTANEFASKCMLISIHRDLQTDVNVHTFVVITTNERKRVVSEAYHVDKIIDTFNTNNSNVFYCYNTATMNNDSTTSDAYTMVNNTDRDNVRFNTDGVLQCKLLNRTNNSIQQDSLCKCIKLWVQIDFVERRVREDKEKANTLMGANTTIRLHRLNIDINVILQILQNDTTVFTAPIFPHWQLQTRFLQEQQYGVISQTESLIHRFNRNKTMKNEFEVRFGHYRTQKQTTHGVARKHYNWLMHTLNTYQIPYVYSYCIDVFENENSSTNSNLRTSYFFQQEDQNEYKREIRKLKKANYKHNIALHQTSKISVYKCIKKTQQDIKNITRQEIDLEETFGYSLRLSVAQEDDAICTAIKKGYDFHSHILQSNVRIIRYKERYSYEFFKNWIIDLTHVTTKYGPFSETQKIYNSHEVEIEFKAYSKEDIIDITELNKVILFVLINLYGKSKIL